MSASAGPSQEGNVTRIIRAVLGWRLLWPLVALAVLIGFNLLFTPGFAVIEWKDGRWYGAMIDVLRNASGVGLLATGMTLVIATAGIDLSVGSVMALAGAVAALLMTGQGWGVWPAVAAGLVAGLAAGLWNGAFVSLFGLQPIIATLVVLVAGRGLAQALTDDQKVRFEAPAFEWIATGAVLGIPTPAIVAAGAAVGVMVLLRATVLGLYTEAVGSNPRAARLCGLPVHRVRLAVYGLSGLFAGAAGLIATADIKEADVANCGLYTELDAILAVVIGGTSLSGGRPRVAGSLVGVLIMRLLTTMLQMHNVTTEKTLVLKAAVALGVCLLQAPKLMRRGAAL
jgi:galactofuranose transport system permease protein